MPDFEVREKCELTRQDMTTEDMANILVESLSQHYAISDIYLTETGVLIDGNLEGAFRRAITKAEIDITIEGRTLLYQASGSVSLGKWPWIFLVLGLFTGFMAGVFLYFFIGYMFSRDKPKELVQDAFKSLQFAVS